MDTALIHGYIVSDFQNLPRFPEFTSISRAGVFFGEGSLPIAWRTLCEPSN